MLPRGQILCLNGLALLHRGAPLLAWLGPLRGPRVMSGSGGLWAAAGEPGLEGLSIEGEE